MRIALIVMAKLPAPGKAKTRLCPPLTEARAAQLYECLLKDALDTARAVPGVTKLIAYAPRGEAGYFQELAPDFDLIPQYGRGLGERLDNAISHCLRDGFDLAAVVGSDSPALSPTYIAQAIALLETVEVVLGPCDDGGYYLIGVKHPQPRLLRQVRMSTPRVLSDTMRLAREEGLRVALAPSCYDVDTIEDLRRLQTELSTTAAGLARHTLGFLKTTSAIE